MIFQGGEHHLNSLESRCLDVQCASLFRLFGCVGRLFTLCNECTGFNEKVLVDRTSLQRWVPSKLDLIFLVHIGFGLMLDNSRMFTLFEGPFLFCFPLSCSRESR